MSRPLLLALLALPAAAQVQIQPRPETLLSNGASSIQRGTNVSSATRRRGIATSPLVLPPRGPGEVWTSKLVHHAWAMNLGGTMDVYYARSVDGGVSWSAPVQLDPAQVGDAHEVSVVANGHNVFVSWLSNENGTAGHVYCAVSTDQGRTFSPPALINDPALVPLGDVDEHWTAASFDVCYFCWEYDDRAVTDEDVHFNALFVTGPGAFTLGKDVYVNRPPSAVPEDVDSPIVVADPATPDVAVLWFDDRGGVAGSNALYCVYSSARGLDFPKPADVTIAAPPAASVAARNHVEAEIAAGYLHLLWEDRRNAAAGGLEAPFYNRLNLATGALLHPGDLDLSGWAVAGAHDIDNPWLAVNRQNPAEVVVAWHDDRDFGGGADNLHNDVFFTITRDSGATWTTAARASRTSGPGSGERNESWGAMWDGDHVALVAERSVGNTPGLPLALEDTIVFLSHDGGRTFADEVFLTAIGSTFATPGFDVDNPFAVMTPARHDIVTSYYHDVTGFNHLYTAGMRAPYVTTSAPFTAGNTVRFEVRQLGAANAGGLCLMVYNARATGTLPGFFTLTGSGVDIDLIPDAATVAFSSVAPLAVLPIVPAGTAASLSFPVPAGWSGPRFNVQAVAFDAMLRATETSDVFAF